MISAKQFLATLDKKDLLPKEVLLSLSQQLAQAQQPVSAADIAHVLIDGGYLTPVLANRLMGVGPEQSSQSAAAPEVEDQLEVVEDIGFAPLEEEREARPVIGRHRAYKPSDSTKISGADSSISKTAKPSDTPSAPKSSLLDQPSQSPWASSVYDRELDPSKGIVSPRLVKMAGVEQIPTNLLLRKKNSWLKLLIRGGIGLGLVVIFYLLITLLFFHR